MYFPSRTYPSAHGFIEQLLTQHPPPSWWPHALSAHDHSGGLRSLLLSSCMQRTRSAHCPVSYPVSVSVSPWSDIPLMARGQPILPEALRWMDCQPAPPAPVCRTRGTIAYCFWAWRRRHRRNAFSGGPRCCPPPPCPAVGAAAPPAPAIYVY